MARPQPKRPKPQPMQQVYYDERGIVRFQGNKIVQWLLDWATPRGMGLNEIAALAGEGTFSAADQEQFAQLIGYSVGGYSELSYVRDKSYNAAVEAVEKLPKPRKAKR